KEEAYTKEPDAELRVWPDGKLPADALTEKDFIRSLVKIGEAQLEALRPRDRESLERFKRVLSPAWKHTMLVNVPEGDLMVEAGPVRKAGDYTVSRLAIGRAGKGDRLPVLMISPPRDRLNNIVILAHLDGKSAFLDVAGAPAGLGKKVLERGRSGRLFHAYLTGEPGEHESLVQLRAVD